MSAASATPLGMVDALCVHQPVLLLHVQLRKSFWIRRRVIIGLLRESFAQLPWDDVVHARVVQGGEGVRVDGHGRARVGQGSDGPDAHAVPTPLSFGANPLGMYGATGATPRLGGRARE